MEQDQKLFDSEYRLLSIVWENEPVQSGELCKLCQESLGWKRTTTYTVLKKLCNKGVLQNESAIVTSIDKREEVQRQEGQVVLDKAFGGSLPQFIAAFLGEQGISDAEAQEIRDMIDLYQSKREKDR
ncbi:MAG: BlaI/MecI/CopY family transcriptional regulator [Oscillospiraceae bacterium]|jgi:predicted transcriptional regulator|nr:BlaI/MecI/CopY family transcriptional regulator [Oscillospiraceae bacterium]